MQLWDKLRIPIGILLLMFMITIPFIPTVKQYLLIPNEIVAFHNDDPIEIPTFHNTEMVSDVKDNEISNNILTEQSLGESDIYFKKNNIPFKKVNLSILENKKIVPGGQSIGVQLQTLGVLVVGHHLVYEEKDSSTSPGESAQIEVGDIILEMNEKKIEKVKDIKSIVQEAGKSKTPIRVKLKRNNKTFHSSLTPILNKHNDEYQIGLYIRDSATGIGTISFYDQESGKYGALGHIISDADTKKPLEINDGKIVNSSVVAIEKGNKGDPGEKQAKFSMKDVQLGTITKNSPFGIFGNIEQKYLNNNESKPMPIALSADVKKGKAEIWTVIDGEKVEAFEVEIVHTIPQKHPATKGMVIKVTDNELLNKTGGIVQGMSGSPIIQDGKLIGAVTHVFVNDPTSGYGVHIEWMLEEAGINIFKSNELAG